MAANTSPLFPLTPRIMAGNVSVANANRDGTGTVVTLGTAGANGTRIEEVVLKATGQPAASNVILFLHDGANYFIWDEIVLGTPAAGSTTVASYRESRSYRNLVLPTGWSLRATITVALTTGVMVVEALGGDY